MKFSKIMPIVYFLALFLVVFASGNELSHLEKREVDLSRQALGMSGVLFQQYDVSGQKFDWVIGTSILGTPGLSRSVTGVSLSSLHFPAGNAGFYAKQLSYDSFTPGLNGENGILKETKELAPLDSPITEILWERGAFEGNAFRLDFRRQIIDSVRLDLGIASFGNEKSEPFTYANVTHQPFFALGRDSSSIPFGGRNISMNTMHLRPGLTWLFGKGEIALHANILFMDFDDVSRHVVVQDTSDYSIYHYSTEPYSTSTRGQGYDASLTLFPTKKLTIEAKFGIGNYEIQYENLPPMIETIKDTVLEKENILGEIYYDSTQDTTWKETTINREYEVYSGEVSLAYKTFLNPTIFFEYEFLSLNSRTKQDKEIGYLYLGDSFKFIDFRLLGGLQRNSSVNNKVEFEPTYSGEIRLHLPYHFALLANHRHDTRFPEVEELRLINQGRLVYPNKNLQPELHYRSAFELGWFRESVFYALGLRKEKVEHLIGERWLSGNGLESEEQAFQLVNFKEAESLDWVVRLGFAFEKWFFYGERGAVLERQNKLKNVPSLYYKGSVGWKDRFVKDRLGVELRLDYQWFGTRYDCGIVDDSIAVYGDYSIVNESENGKHLEIIEMQKYLALDFEARMNILTFDLFARIENLNHSQYMPRVGYTPEGIRFAYGIVWKFTN